MKKLFMMLALLGFVFTSCSDDENGNDSNAKLTLTSESTVSYNAAGGNYSILYTLENPDASVKIEATTNAPEWITDINTQTNGRIFYSVAPNYGEARSGKINVTYGKQGFSVTVNQQKGEPKNYDVEWTAPKVEGYYYGTQYSEGYNYTIILTDNGMNGENFLPNSTYYLVDVYSNVAPANEEKVMAPAGVYTLDGKDTGKAGTISNTYSGYVKTGKSEVLVQTYFSEATLTITETGMELIATIEGEKHCVKFEGEYSLLVDGGEDSYYYSTLESDVTLNFDENTVGELSYWGDYYACGYANYELYLMPSKPGHAMQLEFFTSDATLESGIEGTYNLASNWTNNNYEPMTYLPGYVYEYQGQLYPMGCWFIVVGSEEVEGMAPISDGTITIAKTTTDGKDTYTVTFDCVDDNPETPHSIKGSWSGEMTVVDKTATETASTRSKGVRGTGLTYNKKQMTLNRF